MENQLHPELAFQAGIQQVPQKQYETHPSLIAEVEAEPQVAQEAQPEQEQTDPTVPEPVQSIDIVEEKRHNDKETNLRELRAQAQRTKQIEREAKEREDALARERDFYREQAMRTQKQQEADEDYRTETEKQLSRQMEELKQQMARQAQETEKAKRQAAVTQAEHRLLQDYPDMREVVTNENIQRLETEYPALYNSVIASNDVYSVGAAAYELIVGKGIAQKKTPLSHLAQSSNPNRNKPRSVSTIAPQTGETPIQRAGNFMGNSISSEEERKALYAEMINASRNRAF